MSTTATRPNTQHTTIRIRHDDLAEIDRRARHLRISRSQFLVDSALQRLPARQQDVLQRITDLEAAVERLEQALYTT